MWIWGKDATGIYLVKRQGVRLRNIRDCPIRYRVAIRSIRCFRKLNENLGFDPHPRLMQYPNLWNLHKTRNKRVKPTKLFHTSNDLPISSFPSVLLLSPSSLLLSSSSTRFRGSQVILFSFLSRRRALANQVETCVSVIFVMIANMIFSPFVG